MALGDPDTPALVLFIIALYHFGDEVMGDPDEGIDPMDPAEMWADLNSIYGTWLTEEGENKLNAMINGLRGGLFWRDVDVFIAVSTALFDGDLGDLVSISFEELSATEIMWAMMEMSLAWDSDETPDLSWKIQEYVDEVLSMEQEDQDMNATEVEKSYLGMLDQMRDIGVPVEIIREWDEDYAAVMNEITEEAE